MYRLYKKNELNFSLVWIISYVVLFSVADSFSASLGTEKIIAAPVAIVFTLLLLVFVSKHNLKEKYGLCSFDGSLRNFLYFTPLLLIMSINLWNGVTMKLSVLETVLYILSMLCVGFIEEIIFRGFLFKALYNDNVKLAIVISSVTFGIGHIVNLLNGKDLIPTLLQVCYAIAIGFLFTIIFYKGKSLLPCIIAHSFVNSSSVFAVENSSMKFHIISSAVLCIISLNYALWILKKTKQFDEYENNLFYLHLNSENDAFVNQLLTSLSNFMHTAIKLLEDDKSYSAHVAAVYVLSIFSICPTLLQRAEVYDYLRNLRKECVI